jgi:hypothetical protein
LLILIPFIVIILIIFAVDSIYFDDVKPKNNVNEKEIEKSDNRKNYVNKYLKK